MDTTEKKLRLQALELSLEDLNTIIENMQNKNYPEEQINEYLKKRWDTWNEIYRVKNNR